MIRFEHNKATQHYTIQRTAYLNILPAGVVVEPFVDVVVEALAEPVHEGCTGSDAVRVKALSFHLLRGYLVP